MAKASTTTSAGLAAGIAIGMIGGQALQSDCLDKAKDFCVEGYESRGVDEPDVQGACDEWAAKVCTDETPTDPE